MYTCLAYLVRKEASSMAASPPPITATALLLRVYSATSGKCGRQVSMQKAFVWGGRVWSATAASHSRPV